MKTVRFSQVVARSGEPHVHTLWIAPEKDPDFTRARKTDRVMSVQRGASADFGTIGYEPGQQYLVFPKPLKRFAGQRVVGIKFDLIAQPKAVPASVESRRPPGKVRGVPTRRVGGRGQPPSARSPRASIGLPRRHARAAHSADRMLPADAMERTTEAAEDKAPTPGADAPAEKANALRREIRTALKELKAGKAVAAYQRLERALEK